MYVKSLHIFGGILAPHSCVSEAALWIQNWINRGDLTSHSHGLLYSLDVNDFNRIVLRHEAAHLTVASYAGSVLLCDLYN